MGTPIQTVIKQLSENDPSFKSLDFKNILNFTGETLSDPFGELEQISIIDDSAIEKISEALTNNTVVNSLSISDTDSLFKFQPTVAGARLLVKALQGSNIVSLTLDPGDLDTDVFIAFLGLLADSNTIKNLSIVISSTFSVEDELDLFNALGLNLGKLSGLEKIYIKGGFFDNPGQQLTTEFAIAQREQASKALFRGIANQTNLHNLHIEFLNIQSALSSTLLPASLSHLTLNGCKLTEADFAWFSVNLGALSALSALDLTYTKMSDVSHNHLAHALVTVQATLQSLKLRQTSFTEASLIYYAEEITRYALPIKSIDFSCTEFSDEQLLSLIERLIDGNKSLEEIQLEGLRKDQIDKLKGLFSDPQRCYVSTLEIGPPLRLRNEIGLKSVDIPTIMQIIQGNKRLTSVSVGYTIEPVEKALKYNEYLQQRESFDTIITLMQGCYSTESPFFGMATSLLQYICVAALEKTAGISDEKMGLYIQLIASNFQKRAGMLGKERSTLSNWWSQHIEITDKKNPEQPSRWMQLFVSEEPEPVEYSSGCWCPFM